MLERLFPGQKIRIPEGVSAFGTKEGAYLIYEHSVAEIPALAETMGRAAELAGEFWSRLARSIALPDTERKAWESTGAVFDAPADRIVVEAASSALFEQLCRESIVGNAGVGELLQVGKTRVSQMATNRSLYSFSDEEGARRFPRWQFVGRRPIPGLPTVLAALDPDVHPLTVSFWMNERNVDLEQEGGTVSPVSWLVTGGAPARVAELIAEL
jgi:hypothetical protein